MFYLQKKLKEYGNISVGIVGSGIMGTSLFTLLSQNENFYPIVFSSRNKVTLKNAIDSANIDKKNYAFTDDLEEAKNLLKEKKYIATTNNLLAATLVDCLVDCTGDTETGTKLSLAAIENGVDIVSLNVEMDATVGPILKVMADEKGLVYSGTKGDEPGAIVEIYEFAKNCGFDVLVLGKGKNNELNNYASPESLKEAAEKKGINPRMLTSFVDGTNTMIELNAVCNALGFVPDIRGCHFVDTSPKKIADDYKLKEEGGILNSYGVVDFATGIAPGVFAVVKSKSNIIDEEMKYLSMGQGPNYTIYRPYHLTSIETIVSIIKAVVLRDASIAPIGEPYAETVAVAKRDIKKGEKLDSIGGGMIFGTLERKEDQVKGNHVPIGIVTEGAYANKDIKKGSLLTYEDLSLNEAAEIVKLRKKQDKYFKK
ncbi:NAD(P)H-dependent oxidoreductase [Peptoniphilus grossensis]|uniref:NAD(P)H-dependent oxidoreductase n=1 Tax=Peptoniphilus grossensis TaxID=1465756 RepID=UPI004068D028